MSAEKFPKPFFPSAIEHLAERLRARLGIKDQSHFNIVALLENRLPTVLPAFSIEVFSLKEMSETEAFTEFGPPRIAIRQDVYEGAFRDDTRSRFTLAHELGHLCLHWGFPRPRLAPSKQKFKRSPANERIEAEANRFAGAFLMPRSIADRFDDAKGLARVCRVSDLAASRRLSELWMQKGLTTKAVQALFGLSGPTRKT